MSRPAGRRRCPERWRDREPPRPPHLRTRHSASSVLARHRVQASARRLSGRTPRRWERATAESTGRTQWRQTERRKKAESKRKNASRAKLFASAEVMTRLANRSSSRSEQEVHL